LEDLGRSKQIVLFSCQLFKRRGLSVSESVKGSPPHNSKPIATTRMQVTKVSHLLEPEDVQTADVSNVEGSDRLGHRTAITLRSRGM